MFKTLLLFLAVSLVSVSKTECQHPVTGYECFPRIGCYKFHSEEKTWDEARKICNNEGTHLAVVNSVDESSALQELINRQPDRTGIYDNHFIGFHDRFVHGDYITIFDHSLSEAGFANWSPGEPSNFAGQEHCGTIQKNGLFNDANCDLHITFICEQHYDGS